MSRLLMFAGVFLGWGLGANDSANVFGTAVYTKVVSYRLAIILTSVFVIIGAVVDGGTGINKVSDFAQTNGIFNINTAFWIMMIAATTIFVMTFLKLPVSSSQAIIGAIMGHGFYASKGDFSEAFEFVSAWIFTPLGGMLFALILYSLTRKWLEVHMSNYKVFHVIIKVGYIIAGIFGSYSLGANNVANVFGIFLVDTDYLTVFQASLFGGLAIGIGVLTYSRAVMSTVGKGIMPLTNVSGFLVVVAAAITVYLYARLGIPVSSSQAVVGAIIGIGIVKDFKLINYKLLGKIFAGWVLTPTIAGVISFCAFLYIFN